MGAKLDTGVGAKRGRPEINAEPNVIPFIDVMLVLLIIFMVTAPIASVDIKTDMPDSKLDSSKRPNKPVWITILDDDDCKQSVKGHRIGSCPAIYVMEDEVDVADVGAFTKEALKKANPDTYKDDPLWLNDQRIYVRATGKTEYRNVTRVMNALQIAYLSKIALVADDKKR